MKNLVKTVLQSSIYYLSFSLLLASCAVQKNSSVEPTNKQQDPALVGKWKLEGIRGGDAIQILEPSERLILEISIPGKGEASQNGMRIDLSGPCSHRVSTLLVSKDGKTTWSDFPDTPAACDVSFEERILTQLGKMKIYEISNDALFLSTSEDEMHSDGLHFGGYKLI